jgi:hypothetical protein
MISVEMPITLLANASAASNAMRGYVTPVMATLCVLASLACVFFLVNGGIQYMTSSGRPDKLDHAKKIIRNALIGLVLVIAAATLTAILSHAYTNAGGAMGGKLPDLQAIDQKPTSNGLVDVLVNAVVGLLRNIIQSIGEPFVTALGYFTSSTPLMGDNSSVFNIWLAIVGITDVLFIVIVALIGFQVMSFSSLGMDEIEIKHLLPQMAFIFLLVNTSIFAIDGVIALSNGMIHAIQSGFASTSIWEVLADITKKASDIGLAGLLVMIAFLVLTVMLLVYYVGRLITLYIGVILSPLVLLLWLLPAFKDFTIAALKTYLTTIFVLFVHVVILLLAASIFTGMLHGDTSGQPNTLMALIVGLATLLALLKTQGVMQELSYAASAPRAARELSGSFMRGITHVNRARKGTVNMAKSSKRTIEKVSTMRGGGAGSAAGQGASGKKAGNAAGNKAVSQKAKSTKDVPPLKTGETRKAAPTGDKK